MKVAMMTDCWFPTRDGVVSSVASIKDSLESMGHSVFVIAPEPEKEFRQEGVYYFPAVRFKSYQGYYVPVIPSRKIGILKEINPDVIHIHGVATMAVRGIVFGHRLNIPTVMTFHTMVNDAAKFYLPIRIPQDTADKLIWTYIRQITKRIDVVVTPTSCIGTELKLHGAEFRNLLTIPTGIDSSVFRPGVDCDEIRRRHGLEGKRVAIHVGRISYEKELEMIIRAMKNVDCTLLIAGKGPARDDIESLVRETNLEDRVIFAGFVPDSELPAYYNAADIAVSASKFETQGLSVLEAMACGKAVACRNGRAFAEIIEDGGNGYLFDNEEECAAAMEKAFNAPEHVKNASLQTALNASREKTAEMYVDAYRLAIETGGKK